MSAPPPNLKKEDRSRFLQPLAVALVFLLFALLFFGTAMMEQGRLENLLVDGLKRKAGYVVEGLEQSSLDNYRHLVREEGAERGLPADAGLDEQSFSLQESLAGALIDLAGRIGPGGPGSVEFEKKIAETASSEHLLAVGLFDDQGAPSFQSAPIPADVLSQMRTMAKSREEIAVQLFHGSKPQKSSSFIAIKNRAGKGAVVLVLDRGGMEYWGSRVAIQAAMENQQWGTGIAHISVRDGEGRELARIGSVDSAASERDGAKILELSFPFAWEGKSVGTARVGIETGETDRLLREHRLRIFLWTGLMALIGLFAMGALYRTQNRHIARLQAMREQLYQAERLSSLGKLGAGVAHEIRNPLNAIGMAAQRLQTGGTKEKFDRISQVIQDEIKRLNKIVEDFLSLSRNNRMEFREEPVTALLDRVFFLVQTEAGPRGIRVEKNWKAPSVRLRLDAGKMEQALLNICRNAVESIRGEGSVTISFTLRGKESAVIGVADTGSGIAPEEITRIFDPFYTRKESGVGLGLAIAHEIVLAHGGEIRVESEAGKGSTFEVILPASG